ELERVADRLTVAHEERPRRAQEVRLEGRVARDGEGERHAADDAEHRVAREAGPPPAPLLAAQAAQRVVADEAARLLDPIHDLVAGVDALRAADAVDLQAVADVDAGRAHH